MLNETEGVRVYGITVYNWQPVIMSLKPKEEFRTGFHQLDQFIGVKEGSGEAVWDNVRTTICAGLGIVVTEGTNHNIVNTRTVPLKLYTFFPPPNHREFFN